MRLRTQLVLVSFLLAILPLTAIVIYSYESSRHALENAYRREAARLTRQMDTRLASIRGELETRLADVSALPLQNLPDATKSANPSQHPVVDEVVMTMGDIAPLVDAVEFQPEETPEPAHATAPPVVAKAEPPQASQPKQVRVPMHMPPILVPVGMPEPVVIDLPSTPTPRMVLPPDFKERTKEIRALSAELTKNGANMTQEQRDAITAQIRQKGEEMQTIMNATREQFQKDLRVSLEAQQKRREERQRVREQQMEAATEAAIEASAQASAQASGQASVQAEQAPPAPAPPAVAAPAPKVAAKPQPSQQPVIHVKRKLTEEEKAMIRERTKQVTLLLGHDFAVPVQKEGKIVGRVAAQVSPDEVIRRVLGTNADDGEIPFAIDREGHFYTRNDKERETLTSLGLPARTASTPNWIVVMKGANANGLRVGVARRVGDDLEDLRRTAGRNFFYGLGLVFIALIGIVPIANHMTRDVSAIAQGAERVAQGDLQTRVPVRSKNEVGQLAHSFNKMARQLSEHQQQLVEQRVLAVEYERKANELEEARRFQLSMLPKELPKLDRFDVAVFTQTATEVGGDYYDFHVSDGALTVAIGDATGHGAKAGTMVTVIKTLFAGYSDDASPAQFLSSAAAKIKRMDLGRMAMALSIARLEVNKLTIASAGMPPVLVHRAAKNMVDEIALEATPLGTLGTDYDERAIAIASGDTILFMSDGLPEATNGFGVQLGYNGAADAFASAAVETSAQGVIDRLVAAAREWHGDHPLNDDMTFVAVRVS